MNHAKTIGILFFLSIFFFLLPAGCLNLKESGKKTNYYTLEYESPNIKGLSPLPVTIRIERFKAAPLYDSTQIIFRDKAYKRDAYAYHKWRVNPGDLVTCCLTRDIRQSSLFTAVFDSRSKSVSCRLMEGTVDEFFEDDGKDAWRAVLTLGITLTAKNEAGDKSVLLQKTYSTKTVCRQKNPRALAEAMSIAMSKISETIITDIYNRLSQKADIKS